VAPIWAGEGIDLITALDPAADLVNTMAREAEGALARITTYVERSGEE
jgi:nitronate monooxygenase